MNTSELKSKAFAVMKSILPADYVSRLRVAVAKHLEYNNGESVRGIARKSPEVRSLADSPAICTHVRSVIGNKARLVRSILLKETYPKLLTVKKLRAMSYR